MKKLYLFMLMNLISLCILAGPARKVWRTITVNGGTQLEAMLTGDENCHYWLGTDGNKYVEHDDGTYTQISDGSITAMQKSPRRMPRAARRGSVAAQGNKAYLGQKRGLVILVQFADNQFTAFPNTNAVYSDIMSRKNHGRNLCSTIGSVRDYFLSQSYNKFDFVVDVAGPVTLSQPMKYYGANNRSGDDIRPGSMVWEACTLVDDEVDFSQYDWDDDGKAELVYIIYAGYSEAQGADKNTIWPHAWELSEAKLTDSGIGSCTFDGTVVDAYACSGELLGKDESSVKAPDGIGTICHELSHCFGLPDFYSGNKFCMNAWSLMDYGCYNDNGYTPCSYTAYERWACGWIEPTVLDEPQKIVGMKDLDKSGEAYVIYNDKHHDEYYILQNIQRPTTGWNWCAASHGLLITHVDYDPAAWENNTVNSLATHPRMAVVPADNIRSEKTMDGDLYPNATIEYLNTSLTDTSEPATTLFHINTDGTKLLGKPITDITETSDGLISFNFNNYEEPQPITRPEKVEAKRSPETGITVAWSAVEGAASYNLRYGADEVEDESNEETNDDIRTLVDEDFAKLIVAADKSYDIGDELDNYFTMPGFIGYKVYQGTNGLKINTSTVTNGYLMTPVLTATQGKVSVHISTAVFATDGTKCTYRIKVLNTATNKVTHTSKNFTAGTTADVEVSAPEQFCIRIEATKRMYINALTITEAAPSTTTTPTSRDATITGITSTEHTFMPEFTANKYWVQVQSVDSNGDTSDWTDKLELDTNDAVSITATTLAPATTIHNLQGQQLQRITRPGIYIVNGRKQHVVKQQ